MHFLLFTPIAAQAGCEQTNLFPCKNDADIYRRATCEPLTATNQTHYQHCLCYHLVNLSLCYQQCTSPAAVAEYTGQVAPQTTAQCASIGLNPLALPQPPIWQTWFQSQTTQAQPGRVSPTVVVTVSSPASTATGVKQPNTNTAYQVAQTSLMVSFAILAGLMV
jgi:hypothetical protein